MLMHCAIHLKIIIINKIKKGKEGGREEGREKESDSTTEKWIWEVLWSTFSILLQ